MGLLYGKFELLDELKAYKVRPADDFPPDKFETGTKSHEGIAGILGALEYLEWVGENFGGVYAEIYTDRYAGRGLHLRQAMATIRAYEYAISRTVIDTLKAIPGLRLYGLDDVRRLEERVPTFAFTMEGYSPRQIAEKLAEQKIYVWDGNYYALAVTERLGVEESGGMVRVGPVHYNTLEEIERLGEILRSMV